jgi:hypothetical protein
MLAQRKVHFELSALHHAAFGQPFGQTNNEVRTEVAGHAGDALKSRRRRFCDAAPERFDRDQYSSFGARPETWPGSSAGPAMSRGQKLAYCWLHYGALNPPLN